MRALSIALFVMLMACGGGSAGAPASNSLVGTWNLKTEYGKPSLSRAVFTIAADGTFTYGETKAGDTPPDPNPLTGVFTLNGTEVTFIVTGGPGHYPPFRGLFAGNTLIMDPSRRQSVFQKQ